MVFSIKEKILYASDGTEIKKLYCPKKAEISDLNIKTNIVFSCKFCNKEIYDTAKLTESEIINLVSKDKSSCFKISSNQKNITFKL